VPRGLTAAQKATLKQKAQRPAMFVWLDIAGDPIRAWDGVGDVITGGATWDGVGQLGMVEGIGTERGMRSQGISVGIHGLPSSMPTVPSIIRKTRNVSYQGSPMYVYMCNTAVETDIPLSDPWLMWRGVADVMSYQIGESISLSLSGEHYSSHAARVNDQSDSVFRFLTRLAGKAKKLV
jgi:hypothetical protein